MAETPRCVLLACARPLIVKIERWEADLNEPASAHVAAAEAALGGIVAPGAVAPDGRVLRFDLYPPRPPESNLRERLGAALPLADLRVQQEVVR